ncbi:hypothetical protein WSS15_28000 [Acetobacter pasteurianus]|nr:hypothetical protein [Acetobacter pasteurianus]GLH30150.1 hypothetical protein WSS15_28000 [Acetobacter pasteurianus]
MTHFKADGLTNKLSTHFGNVPIPSRMLNLRRLNSGLPIPKFATWEGDKPNLTVMNRDFFGTALRNKLCWICGQKMGRFASFVGGPKSTASKCFVEPPMHRDCAEFAMQVCPYLVTGNNERKNKLTPLEEKQHRSAGTDPDNPIIFGMSISNDWHFISGENCFFLKNVAEVIWWKHGKLASSKEAEKAVLEGEQAVQAAMKEMQSLTRSRRLKKYPTLDLGRAVWSPKRPINGKI